LSIITNTVLGTSQECILLHATTLSKMISLGYYSTLNNAFMRIIYII